MNTTNKSKRVLHFALLIAAATLIHQEPLIAGRHYVGFSGTPSGAAETYAGTNAGLTDALNAAGTTDTVYIAKGLTFYLDAELTVNEYIIGGCDPAGDGSLPTRTAIGAANSITGNMTVGGTTTIHAHEVGKKAATSAGLYDMSGNLWEWCIDAHGSYLNAAGSLTVVSGKNLVSSDVSNTGATSSAPLRNPIAYAGSFRMHRGGSWNYSAAYCSLGYRDHYSTNMPSSVGHFIGFRSVCCP
jgi:hypothetical protein